jgi:hypothetical protein
MQDAMSIVKTGQITYAVRDTRVDNKEIHEGDYMGVGDKGILAVGKDRIQVALDTLEEMADDSCEVISVYYGTDTTEEEVASLEEKITEKTKAIIGVHLYGQPFEFNKVKEIAANRFLIDTDDSGPVYITVLDDTEIFKGSKTASVTDIKVGSRLKVAHNGIVLKSYPGQINVVYRITVLEAENS